MSWQRYFRRAKWDRERLEEMESYLQVETDENIARGMTPADARAAAHRKLGNSQLIREEIYQMNTIGFLDALARDLRHALRTLRHNPTFTAVALLTLAIGIGANTAVFSVVNSVLLKPLPYPQSDRVVSVSQVAPGAEGLASVSGGLHLSASMYVTYSEQNRTFQSFGVWAPLTVAVTGVAEPEQVPAVLVSDGVLQALSVPPMLGRWLNAADQVPNSANTVVLSYGYWQRRFGRDPSVVGRNIIVEARPRQVVGIMPRGWKLADTNADVILPARIDRSNLILAGFGYEGIARLKSGVTVAQANADMARLIPIWLHSWTNGPGTSISGYLRWRITPALRLLKDDVTGNVGDVLWVLMGTIGIVMLIACANVANLLLVRAEARRHELAVRAALGAGRGRIVRELLVESLLLAILGAAMGLGIAYAGLRLLVRSAPAGLPRLDEIAIDPRALAFTLGLSLISGLLFGLLPALKNAKSAISNSLRASGRTSSDSRERHRARNLLVVAQVALALMLLIASSLMIRTFFALRAVQPGFTNAEQIQTLRISIPQLLIPDAARTARMQNDLLDRLKAIPGVTSAGFISSMPMEGIAGDWDEVRVEGKTYTDIPPMRMFRYISPGYFQTAGTKIVTGRDYTWDDLYGARHVVIISENLARELFGSPVRAIGKRVRTGRAWHEVIGVVEDVRDNGVHEAAPAIVYWPDFMDHIYYAGRYVNRTVTFALRSARTGSAAFLDQIRQAVWAVNPSLPVDAPRSMQQIYDHSLARTSFTLVMLAIAGSMALLLGIIGIYGVIAYTVAQRRREVGIRVALGARPAAIPWIFVRSGLLLAIAGTALGLAAAAGLSRLMSSLLFGVSPVDPVTFAATPVILLATAVAACYLPARRAARFDPAETLRAE